MSFRPSRRNWRNHAWAWYLAATGALTAAYLFFPPLAGNGPLINSLGLLGVLGVGRLEFSSAATDDAEVVFWQVPRAVWLRDTVRSLEKTGA